MNNTISDFTEDTASEKMSTLSSSINHAVKKGYRSNFKVKANGMLWDSDQQHYDPEEVIIDDFYRFEGESDPGDNAILYLIRTADGNKGTLIDAYGVYEDADVSEFIRNVVDIHKKKHQLVRSLSDGRRYIAAATLLAISGLLFLAMGRKNNHCK